VQFPISHFQLTVVPVTPELACLPKQYHQFITPSIRRVYLDLTACSALQGKLEKAETRLKLHKNHEEALTKQCDSLSAALTAHRAGESKAIHETKVLQKKLAVCIENHENDVDAHAARYQRFEQEIQLLQSKYRKLKQHNQQLNEEALTHKAEQQQQQSLVDYSDPSTSRGLAMELRTMKPLPKRRVSRRARSNSPPLVFDTSKVIKRARLSDSTRQSQPS